MSSTRSATRPWFLAVSAPITAHCSAVDSSMRVKVVAMGPFSLSAGQVGELSEDIRRGDVAIAGDGVGTEQVAELAGEREVLVLGGDADLLDAVPRRQP